MSRKSMRSTAVASGWVFALSLAGSAISSEPVTPEPSAADRTPSAVLPMATAAPAAGPSTADKLLAEIDAAVELAREGGYGRLKRGDSAKLEKARDRINALLAGHPDPAALPDEARLEVYNAQQLIVDILGKDDQDRVVCKREATLGSRVAGTECLTVGQREARARQSRENTGFAQREHCVPGAGDDSTSSCI